MKNLNLLIVEDDHNMIKSYERDVKSFNLHSEVKIVATIEPKKDKALQILEDNKRVFDAAIVDLKLDKEGEQDNNFSGNEVIRRIKGDLRFPVFVISGTTEHLDDDLKDQNCFFKIKVRGEEHDYLEQLVDIYRTGITNILGEKGEIEKYLNSIFWSHLSSSMDMWVNDKTRNSIQKEKSLLRYTLLHINEYIDQDLDKYHPNEFYITEPVKSSIFTGDIVEYKHERFIVLTPSCDIVLRDDMTRNAEQIFLCKVRELDSVIGNFSSLNESTGPNNPTRQKLERLIQNGKHNFHFIPKSNSISAGLIDFQDKLTISEDIIDKLVEDRDIKRMATVSLPFLKDIISRYSSYYARQGAPDFDTKEIYQSLF